MGLRKLPSEFTTEELLELAKDTTFNKEERDVITEHINDVVPFLSHFDIKPGTDIITKRFFYNLYKEWSTNPILKASFDDIISQYFLIHQKGNKYYYLINKNSLQLSKRLYKLILERTVDKTKSKNYKNHFDSFLTANKVKAGNYWIESFILYYLYDKWTYKNKNNNPLGRNQFFNFCTLYFKHKRRTSNRLQWFAVNKSILKHFTSEQLERIRKGHDDASRKPKKTKNKKIEREIPST